MVKTVQKQVSASQVACMLGIWMNDANLAKCNTYKPNGRHTAGRKRKKPYGAAAAAPDLRRPLLLPPGVCPPLTIAAVTSLSTALASESASSAEPARPCPSSTSAALILASRSGSRCRRSRQATDRRRTWLALPPVPASSRVRRTDAWAGERATGFEGVEDRPSCKRVRAATACCKHGCCQATACQGTACRRHGRRLAAACEADLKQRSSAAWCEPRVADAGCSGGAWG